MDLKLLNEQGQAAATFSAPDTIFGRDFNEALIHQVVVAFQANARAGNRAQKDRSEVKHTTKALAPEGYRSRSRRYDLVAAVAWWWSHLPELA